MSADFIPTFYTNGNGNGIKTKMAARHKCPNSIERMKHSDVCVPWCDEFEKMICGMNFKAANAQVMLDHKLDIRKRLLEFNDERIPNGSTLESLKLRRLAVAKRILGKLGKGTNIEAPGFFVTFGCNTFVGENVYINRRVEIYDSAPVTIGNRTLIGPNCCICTDTHEVESADRLASNSGSYAKKIKIGDDCWIGANVLILPGVTIGRGCTIAAGAVVAKDIEENSLVGGVPARLIRKLLPPGPDA